MLLSKWVKEKGWGELTRLRKATGLTYATLHSLYRREHCANYDTGLLIEKATDGSVTVHDVCKPLTPAEHKAAAKRKRERKRRLSKRDQRVQRPNAESVTGS
jgi:hypothetical protein